MQLLLVIKGDSKSVNSTVQKKCKIVDRSVLQLLSHITVSDTTPDRQIHLVQAIHPAQPRLLL